MSGGTKIVQALYADDFLHFTDNPKLYQAFKDQFQKRFDIKTGSVSVYLGNRITVDRTVSGHGKMQCLTRQSL